MNRFDAYVALNMTGGIGTVSLNKILEALDKPQDIFKLSADKLVGLSGMNREAAERIVSFKTEKLGKEYLQAKKLGLKIVSIEDAQYPEQLKNIPSAPLVLYVKGEISSADRFAVAIVGSRKASVYGLICAQNFASDLCMRGFTVVSGMARGIDTYAHKGAIKVNGRTIAVLGSGFNNVYPQENLELLSGISEHGAVISEFSLDTPPRRENFPRRNRILSGLSQGVLVIEAGKKSGALITADFALEQGREVFALPGKIDSPNSFGTNELIKQGAKLVANADDILEELALPMINCLKEETKAVNSFGLDKEEEGLYRLFGKEALGLDDLAEETKFDIMKISAILLKLQLKSAIKQLPGKHFVRSSDEK